MKEDCDIVHVLLRIERKGAILPHSQKVLLLQVFSILVRLAIIFCKVREGQKNLVLVLGQKKYSTSYQ